MITRIKICGLTCVEDALLAVEAGADALGFVFAASPRRIAPAMAGAIIAALPPFVRTFGVTVNASAEEIEEILDVSGVDALQFHGDETPRACFEQRRPVVKRVAVLPDDDDDALLRRATPYAGLPLLVDPGSGDGRPFAFELAACLPRPFVLAGGLDADNVGPAIRRARPDGIDVCSGVEASAGRKCPERLRALIRAVRSEDARHAA